MSGKHLKVRAWRGGGTPIYSLLIGLAAWVAVGLGLVVGLPGSPRTDLGSASESPHVPSQPADDAAGGPDASERSDPSAGSTTDEPSPTASASDEAAQPTDGPSAAVAEQASPTTDTLASTDPTTDTSPTPDAQPTTSPGDQARGEAKGHDKNGGPGKHDGGA